MDPFIVNVVDTKKALERAKKIIEKNKGSISSNNFMVSSPLGKFVGEYTIEGNAICITITKKPFLITEAIVEEKVREYFSVN